MSRLATGPGGLAAVLPCSPDLVRLAPDIAHRVAATWSNVAATSRLLEDLLVSDSMASLSAGVTGELLRLYEYHARCRASDAPDTAWEMPASRLQSLSPYGAFQASQR
jgi:hypothetical protein